MLFYDLVLQDILCESFHNSLRQVCATQNVKDWLTHCSVIIAMS